MKVLNYMEDLVITRTNELYDEVKEMDAPWLNCDCEHCRLDTISYALNRLPRAILSREEDLSITPSTKTANSRPILTPLLLKGCTRSILPKDHITEQLKGK